MEKKVKKDEMNGKPAKRNYLHMEHHHDLTDRKNPNVTVQFGPVLVSKILLSAKPFYNFNFPLNPNVIEWTKVEKKNYTKNGTNTDEIRSHLALTVKIVILWD